MTTTTRSSTLCFVSFVMLGAGLIGAPACDNSVAENEAALPGVGPIGAGGAPYLGGGGAGAGGEAGQGGASGEGGGGAGGSAGSAGSGGSGGSSCAGTGKARLRVGNLRPAAGKVDFCVRRDPDTDFSKAQRLVDAAQKGLAFGEFAKLTEVDAGGISLKAIDASAADCTGEALASLDLCLTDKQDLSLPLLEGSIARFNNADTTSGNNRIRFVHALAGEGLLDVAVADDTVTPKIIIPPPVFTNIGYGQTSPAGSTEQGFAITADGYLDLKPDDLGGVIPVGAGKAGVLATGAPTEAFVVVPVDLETKGQTMTAYAAGKKDDAAFPYKVFLCNEAKNEGALTSCATFLPAVRVSCRPLGRAQARTCSPLAPLQGLCRSWTRHRAKAFAWLVVVVVRA